MYFSVCVVKNQRFNFQLCQTLCKSLSETGFCETGKEISSHTDLSHRIFLLYFKALVKCWNLVEMKSFSRMRKVMISFVSRKWHSKDGLTRDSQHFYRKKPEKSCTENLNSLFSSRYLTGSFRALIQTTFSETEKKPAFFFFSASFTNKNHQNEKKLMLCKWCK